MVMSLWPRFFRPSCINETDTPQLIMGFCNVASKLAETSDKLMFDRASTVRRYIQETTGVLVTSLVQPVLFELYHLRRICQKMYSDVSSA